MRIIHWRVESHLFFLSMYATASTWSKRLWILLLAECTFVERVGNSASEYRGGVGYIVIGFVRCPSTAGAFFFFFPFGECVLERPILKLMLHVVKDTPQHSQVNLELFFERLFHDQVQGGPDWRVEKHSINIVCQCPPFGWKHTLTTFGKDSN